MSKFNSLISLIELVHTHAIDRNRMVIYMGVDTFAQLFVSPNPRRPRGDIRPTFHGVPIFIVDEEHYIAIGVLGSKALP